MLKILRKYFHEKYWRIACGSAMMTWPCFAVADVFLQFPLCLPHVVLVVGTYQGITDRFMRR